MIEIDDVRKIMNQQEEWRSNQCINLIASENAQSPLVKELMVSDFVSRYAEGHPNTGIIRGRSTLIFLRQPPERR